MKAGQQYQLGMSAYNAARYPEAIEHLQQLAADGQSATAILARFYLGQAHYRLAVALFEQHRFGEATNYFRTAAEINPVGGGFARYLAACYVGTGRFDLAGRELEGLLRQNPDDAGVRIRLALTQYKQGNPLEATTTLREGLRRRPDHAELHYQLGVMLAAADELAEAEQLFHKTIALEPTHAGAYERLAQCCSLNNRHERALRYLEKAHHLEPGDTRVAMQLNLLAQSLTAAESVQAGAGRPMVEWHLDQHQHAASRLDQAAIDRLGEVILKEPDFVEAFLSLPTSKVDGEIFSALAATLEQALSKHPEYADLHYHCGAVYRRLGRSDEAIAHAERAVQINAKYIKALVLLAELYGQTDRWHDGVERLEQAVRAGADYPDLHYLIGSLYESGQRLDRARAAYRRAIEANGDYQAARKALALLPG